MKIKFGAIIIAFIILIIYTLGIGLIISLPLTWIWNAVIPSIFGLNEITYLQMFGLYFLMQILFKINVEYKK